MNNTIYSFVSNKLTRFSPNTTFVSRLSRTRLGRIFVCMLTRNDLLYIIFKLQLHGDKYALFKTRRWMTADSRNKINFSDNRTRRTGIVTTYMCPRHIENAIIPITVYRILITRARTVCAPQWFKSNTISTNYSVRPIDLVVRISSEYGVPVYDDMTYSYTFSVYFRNEFSSYFNGITRTCSRTPFFRARNSYKTACEQRRCSVKLIRLVFSPVEHVVPRNTHVYLWNKIVFSPLPNGIIISRKKKRV